MQVTIGARCWDGVRRRSLVDAIKVEGLPQPVEKVPHIPTKWLNQGKVKSIMGYAVPLMLLASGLPPIGLTNAFAQTFAPQEAVPVMGGAIKEQIMHAFDPLINLIQSMAYPIAGVMIAGGCLFIMVGNREKGMSMLQNAAIGYILVQLAPMMLGLLVGIGNSM